MNRISDKVHGPSDLSRLSPDEKKQICRELRERIIETVSVNGGHLSSNLGTVELTVALETVFSGPNDRIIWDVGHQCYAHKLLTGRNARFDTLRKTDGISGFQSPKESASDPFYTGHAGVAVSTALGMASAYEKQGIRDSMIVAVVGDGALGSGPSLEALNSIRDSCAGGFLLVINDNRMSISRSVGALSEHLNRIITGRVYNRFKATLKYLLRGLPLGHKLILGIKRLESAAKSLLVPGAFFEELGFKYVGPVDGHDLDELITSFRRIREIRHIPVCVHVVTRKGYGCPYAERSPEKYHGVSPFDPSSGEIYKNAHEAKTFSQAFGESATALAEKFPEVVAITAAMSSGTGLKEFEKRFPDRFYDVGIAEEHSAAFAAGLAAGGLRPIVAMYATFLQRALDQVFHDVCLQGLPVVFCVDRSGVVEDGPTHHGIYDSGFFQSLPGLTVMQPSSATQLSEMLFAAYRRKGPVMIRYPKGPAPEIPGSGPLKWGCSCCLRSGRDGMIWGAGAECHTALAVSDLLRHAGLEFGVRDMRFLKPLDRESLKEDMEKYGFLVTIEDNIPCGGLGAAVDSAVAEIGGKHPEIFHFGWPSDQYVPHGNPAILREKYHLTPEWIAEKIRRTL